MISEHEYQREQDIALICASEMRIKSSEYRQMGFLELARYLKEQARKAENYAATLGVKP